jgi:Ni/Fe-hydrogenase subunit HybB-like protein
MLFLLEIGLGVLLPMVMLFMLSQGEKRDENSILFAQSLVIGGVILNRLNIVYLSQKVAGVSYTPSWMEFALTAGLIAIILVIYRAAVLYLPIMKHAELDH